MSEKTKIQHLNELTGMWSRMRGNVKALDLSALHTTGAENMSRLFAGMYLLREIDMSTIRTDDATDLSEMFSGCWSLEAIDLSGVRTPRVKRMKQMFFK